MVAFFKIEYQLITINNLNPNNLRVKFIPMKLNLTRYSVVKKPSIFLLVFTTDTNLLDRPRQINTFIVLEIGINKRRDIGYRYCGEQSKVRTKDPLIHIAHPLAMSAFEW
jgi:hypothetical protein